MEIRKRLQEVRKALKINQAEFGRRIGVTRSAVCNYESGSRSIGEQVILAVCREFGVNEEWFRYGKGSPFKELPSRTLDVLAQDYKLSQNDIILIQKLLGLNPETRESIIAFMCSIADATRKDESVAEREARLLRQEADAVERGGDESSASPVTKEA